MMEALMDTNRDFPQSRSTSRLRPRSGSRSGPASPPLRQSPHRAIDSLLVPVSPGRLSRQDMPSFQNSQEMHRRARSTGATRELSLTHSRAGRVPGMRSDAVTSPPSPQSQSPLFSAPNSPLPSSGPGMLKASLAGILRQAHADSDCKDTTASSSSPPASPVVSGSGSPKQLLATLARIRNEEQVGKTTEKGNSGSVVRLPGCTKELCRSRSEANISSPESVKCKASLDEIPGESGLLARRRADRPSLKCISIEQKERREIRNNLNIRELEQGQKIFDLYYWDEVIQEDGCGGKVVVCSPKDASKMTPRSPFAGRSSQTQVEKGTHVMKIKSKERLEMMSTWEQFRKAHVKMLNLPLHKGILPLYEVLEDKAYYYVVMEKAKGGALLDSLLDEYPDGVMPEKAVKRLMKDILAAVAHLHREGILHRDLKIENLVVELNDEPASPSLKVRTVKIIDFDTVEPDWLPNSPGKKQAEWAGTLRNSAPETFRGFFSQQSDLYSVGTILYLLMCGQHPYADEVFEEYSNFENLKELSHKLSRMEVDWTASCWRKSPTCLSFCKSLLAQDPEKRPTSAEEAVRHEWFSQR